MVNKGGTFSLDSSGIAERQGQREEITEYTHCEMCGHRYASYYKTVKAHYSNDYFTIEKCKKCGLVYVNPRLNSVFRNFCYEMEEHLVDYFLSREESGRRIANHILDTVTTFGCRQGTLLEIGCGIGIMLDEASKRGFDVTGVELNQYTASYAAARHNIIQGDFLDLQLPKSHFDLVIMEQTLEHVSEPFKTLQKISEIVKKGGYVYIGVPKFDWYMLMKDLITSRCKDDSLLWTPEDHLFYFRNGTIRMMMEKAGFHLLDISGMKWKWRLQEFLGLSTGKFLGRK